MSYVPSHFETILLFALFASVVMGIVGRSTNRDRLNYGLYCFLYFLGVVFVLGWLMRLGHG